MNRRWIPTRGACSEHSGGLLALVCSARYPMNGARNLTSELAREGLSDRKMGVRSRHCHTLADRPLCALCIRHPVYVETLRATPPLQNSHLAYTAGSKNGHLAEDAALPIR